jgi:molybdopterin-binding protein
MRAPNDPSSSTSSDGNNAESRRPTVMPPAQLQLHFSSGRGYSVPVHSSMPRLYTPRDAAQMLGISYPSLKQWIYRGKLKTVHTAGGHHRIPESEINRLLPVVSPVTTEARRRMLRRISGRNKLIGRVLDVKISGFVARVTLSIEGQRMTSIITADAARELRLKKGQIVAAVIKSTQVMVIRPG